MSNLPGNHYMQQLVECTMPKTPESLATLALAYEQRTANLIAVAAHQDQMGKIGDGFWEEVANRLGLGDTQ